MSSAAATQQPSVGQWPDIQHDPDREAIRLKAVAAKGSWYNPYLHLALPSIFGLGIIALAIASLRDLRALELLTVPLTWLIGNAAEWRIHRDLLHKRNRLAPVLYDRHTPLHHRVYITDDMAIRSVREFGLVLLPAYAILLIFLGMLPIVGVLWWAGLPNVALLFIATDLGYTLGYEWLHLSYHLPRTSRIGNSRFIRGLRRHHAVHHDPKNMQKWNFNVTVPLWDWVRGTIKPTS